MLVLATVLAILAIFAIWADRQLMNPRNWADTSTALLQKPTIRSAVSSYVVDQLYAHVSVPDELRSGLPQRLQPLAGPLSGVLHSAAEQAAERLLASPRAQDAWRAANRAADETLVAIVKGGKGGVRINRGTVTLNLREILTGLAQRLGLDPSLVQKVPPSVAEVKVFTSNDLGVVRTLAKALHTLALVLTIVVLALYVLAVAVARGRRRRTLMSAGLSLVLAGLVVLVARRIAQGQLVGAIVKDASIEPAANDTYAVATSLLVQVASASIVIGLPVIAAAWFAGPARWAVAGRRFWAAPLRQRPELAYWVTAGLLALVFVWGPIPATRNPIEMALFTVLAFLGAHVLRAQISREFPDVEPISVGAAIREHARGLGDRAAHVRGSILPGTSSRTPELADELERLEKLRGRGALSDEEYALAKREVLRRS